MPSTKLPRPAGPRSANSPPPHHVSAVALLGADVRPPRGKRALEALERDLLELEAEGRTPTPAEIEKLLRLAQAARAGDAAAGEGA